MCATANEHLHERVNGLPAKIEHDSVVLILGTLPGKRSLMTRTYYADPSNKFWDILFMACGEKIEKSDTARELLLKKYHIALWDILHSAVRDTSSDKDLLDEEPNDLPQYLAEYPQIKLLLFHSNDSYRYFKRFFKNTAVPYIVYPHQVGKTGKAHWKKQRNGERPYLVPFHNLELGQGWRGRGHPHVI